MSRIELNEEMMEQVNGGEYRIYALDTDEYLSCYTLKDSLLDKVKLLNANGMDVKVTTTNIFDDDSVAGVYLANAK